MFCSDIPAPIYLIFSDFTPQLLYYSHIPTAIISVLLAVFVIIKNKPLITPRILLSITLLFFIWSFFDLILWTNINSGVVLFFWSIINLIEMLVSVFVLYFSYVFLEKKDVSFGLKLFFALLLSVFIVFIPTRLNLTGFDYGNCESLQGQLLNYYYVLEAFFSLWLLVYLAKKIKNAKRGDERKKTVYLSLGVVFFLLSFSGTNIFSSITTRWEILQYGLFGMTFFMAMLAFMIVKFKAFNIKLLGAQALVVALVILIGSQFFFIRTNANRILTGITLLIASGIGWALVRSVKSEVKKKEELQAMTDKLSAANDKLRTLDNAKSEFISIASHQLRTPLTAIKGYLSLLLEGSYGEISDTVRGTLDKVQISGERLIQLVENLLNISRIEAGRMQYNFGKNKMERLLKEVYDTLILSAQNKNLKLTLNLPEDPMPEIVMDNIKIKEVVSNLTDNAIKYTQFGSVDISAEVQGDKIRITVSDTGIGILPEKVDGLFEKFARGSESGKFHGEGAGLGLYVCKSMVAKHEGKIWVESEGENKGSRFIVELPIAGPKNLEG